MRTDLKQINIKMREQDWRNLRRIEELLRAARPEINVNQTVALRHALFVTVATMERQAAAIVSEGNGRNELAPLPR